jgi:hypothetical protein
MVPVVMEEESSNVQHKVELKFYCNKGKWQSSTTQTNPSTGTNVRQNKINKGTIISFQQVLAIE